MRCLHFKSILEYVFTHLKYLQYGLVCYKNYIRLNITRTTLTNMWWNSHGFSKWYSLDWNSIHLINTGEKIILNFMFVKIAFLCYILQLYVFAKMKLVDFVVDKWVICDRSNICKTAIESTSKWFVSSDHTLLIKTPQGSTCLLISYHIDT